MALYADGALDRTSGNQLLGASGMVTGSMGSDQLGTYWLDMVTLDIGVEPLVIHNCRNDNMAKLVEPGLASADS